jgi:hypothetical protein
MEIGSEDILGFGAKEGAESHYEDVVSVSGRGILECFAARYGGHWRCGVLNAHMGILPRPSAWQLEA